MRAGDSAGQSARVNKMDPWRDYPKFTDGALDAFIKRFPSHPDHAAAVAELHRRRQGRHRRGEGRSVQLQEIPVGKGLLMWAIAGIAILALVVLSLTLGIFTPKTHDARRPKALRASFPEPATPVPTLFPPAEGFIRGSDSQKPSATKTPAPRSSPELTP